MIVDDDAVFCRLLRAVMLQSGYDVNLAASLAEAREVLAGRSFDLIFLDVYLPDGNGLELLPFIKGLPDAPEVIVITADGDPDGAEVAITRGAWDYLGKAASMDRVLKVVARALKARNKRLHTGIGDLDRVGIIGNSPGLRACLELVRQAASSDAPVLIIGETGTGKELIAKAVHRNSRRANNSYVPVDCGAVSEALLESELFGSMRGAFTGAVNTRPGLIHQADGGTLFLDEVGELPSPQQKSFLRVLQERKFRPLGGTAEIPSDFRLVAATNRDLNAMAEQGRFRKDLLFRLQGVVINLPPLRARCNDILELAEYALARAGKSSGEAPKDFAAETVRAIMGYSWPGNVRELFYVVEYSVLAAKGEAVILPEHLPLQVRASAARHRVSGENQDRQAAGEALPDAPALLGGEAPFSFPLTPRYFGEERRMQSQLERRRGGGERRKNGAGQPVRQSARPPVRPMEPGRPFTDERGHILNWKEFHSQVLAQEEKRYLLHLLEECGGNIPLAAQKAELSRQRLYVLLRQHNIARQWRE